jgi:hypothetical protein
MCCHVLSCAVRALSCVVICCYVLSWDVVMCCHGMLVCCSPVLVGAFEEYNGAHKQLLQQQFLSDFTALYEVGRDVLCRRFVLSTCVVGIGL